MYALLDRALKHVIKSGTLVITDARGMVHRYGDGSGDAVRVRLTDRATRRIAFNPDLALGEAYMDGELTLERGTIFDLLTLLLKNLEGRKAPFGARVFDRLRILTKRLDQYNPMSRSKRNVAHHYDLNGALYDLFLDRDRQYSCAYFETSDVSLEEAQLAKKRHLAAGLGRRLVG